MKAKIFFGAILLCIMMVTNAQIKVVPGGNVGVSR
jgi:hypothetical protein